jgi:hypothetical protein
MPVMAKRIVFSAADPSRRPFPGSFDQDTCGSRRHHNVIGVGVAFFGKNASLGTYRLVTPAIVSWKLICLERAVAALLGHGQPADERLLRYLSSLHWGHINPTSDCLWLSAAKFGSGRFRPLWAAGRGLTYIAIRLLKRPILGFSNPCSPKGYAGPARVG